jgi:hypothetical protein
MLFFICSCKSKHIEVDNSKNNQTIAKSLIDNREINATGIICTKEATYHRNTGVNNGVAYGILTVRFSDDSYAWVLVADAKQFATIQIGDNILVNALYSSNYPRVTY